MIINSLGNTKKQLAFIHIPKTGGMSCLHFFSYYKLITHSTIKEDSEVLKKEGKNISDIFSFSIIRNPWDRMVSNYFFHRNREHNDVRLHKKIKESELSKWITDHKKENYFWKSVSFKDWLKYFDESKNLESVSIYDEIIKKNYIDYIGIDGKIAVDYIINLHNISNEILPIKEFAMKKVEYPHTNKSEHKDYREYYDDESIEIVEKFYKKDIEAFNFKFENKNYAENEKYWNGNKVKKITKIFRMM